MSKALQKQASQLLTPLTTFHKDKKVIEINPQIKSSNKAIRLKIEDPTAKCNGSYHSLG